MTQNFLITLLDGTEVVVNGVAALNGYGQNVLPVDFIGEAGDVLYTLQPDTHQGFWPVSE